MLRLAHHWIWDSWIADDGERYHLFFLKAPRALADPARRHAAARIGHATSVDLVEWTVHPDALHPVESGWDDLALWTGSVARGDDGVWRLYYTAVNTHGGGLRDQRIGVAESDDLMTWRRLGDAPIVNPDPRWYATLDGVRSDTWRDPAVFRDPAGDGWHMLVSARAPGAGSRNDGVLAHARSADMRTWELGPPACAPGAGFGQLEVPQVRVVDGTPLLVFTCHPNEQSTERTSALGRYCTWSVAAASVLGPWDVGTAQPFRADPLLFAAPLVQGRDGGWAFIGCRTHEPESGAAFEIVDPISVQRQGGALVRR